MSLLDELNGICIGSQEINSVYLGNQELWSWVKPTRYLTFTSTGGNTLSMLNYNYDNSPRLYYSTDAEKWRRWDYSSITIPNGASVYIAGINPNGIGETYDKHSRFVINGNGTVACSGDVTSLLNPYETVTAVSEYCFAYLFANCTLLTSAPALPATTLAKYCYYKMFYGCASLASAPALPATELAEGCYKCMFQICNSLTSAPALPATTLANECYASMFRGCENLLVAPALPATKLVERCYYAMFNGCTLLSSIKCLATNRSANEATYYWVYRVSANGTFTKEAGVTWPNGVSGIPNDWSVIEQISI